jgi:hypothetical protein
MSAVPSASVRLGRKLELLVPAFGTPGRLLADHPRAPELVGPYLAAGSYVTIVMVPLMEAALERARALAPADGVAARLVGYLERHIPEEMHGDVPGGAALADLAALGVDTEAVRLQPLPEKIAALIGTLYFRIVHAHPVAILGLLWLESYPPDRMSVERLMERTRLPDDGFRQLFLHAEVDLRHGEELRELLDALPLEPWHEQLITLTAFQTMSFFVHAWLGVLDDADERRGTNGDPGRAPPTRAGGRVAPSHSMR